MKKTLMFGCLIVSALCLDAAGKPKNEGRVEFHGYSDCIQLENRNTRVILSGACGGRVLEYSLHGVNALFLNPLQDGWTYSPGKPTIDPSAGRMDVGPENILPKHRDLWLGRWQAKRTGPLSARMTSVADRATGLRLVRDFTLSKNSSTLTVTQTIQNVSSEPVRAFHWSRTFAPSGGICIVPLAQESPFSQQYVMWEPGNRINFSPQDKRLVRFENTLFITGVPRNAKIGISSSGKIAYLTPNNLLFTKKFAVYRNRIYGEMVSMNACVCYAKKFCELEPIGPQERIEPGESVSYTETWSLASCSFPDRRALDFQKLNSLAGVNNKK